MLAEVKPSGASKGHGIEPLLAEPPFAGATVELVPAQGDELRVDYLEVDDDGASD